MHASPTALAFLVLLVVAQGASVWNKVAPSTDALPDGRPPSSFTRRSDNISPQGLSAELDVRPVRLHTNKFYSDFLLDGPARTAWTLPYVVAVNTQRPFGMSVSMPTMTEGLRNEKDDSLKYYITTAAKDVIMSAKELSTDQRVTLTAADSDGFSATVEFASKDAKGSMEAPLVRGMAYATVLYDDFTPVVSSIHAIMRVNGISASSRSHASSDGKFVVEFNDGNTWILYASETDLKLTYVRSQSGEPNALKATSTFTGTLRAARVPYRKDSSNYSKSVAILDEYARTYPIQGKLKAWMHKANDKKGKYKIKWKTGGEGSGLLHYALPHQQDLLDSDIKTGLFLRSPTKGNMEMVIGTVWAMVETSLPSFEWVPAKSGIDNDAEMDWIITYLEKEIATPLDNFADGGVYFGGKSIMAYAQMCLIAEELERPDLVKICVDQVEAAFGVYLRHQNGNPLVYDTTWGGIIGSSGLESGGHHVDFSAHLYNDHHFHYGYVINAAAVLAHLRPSWATDANKAWVDTLIRDVNDPNSNDPYFPQFRAFDWFSGHSWAKGVIWTGDGKDQESTSEDVNFFYAMTMWGIATGNAELEGLGRLQTGVVTRSINEYFLLKNSNTNHPADFVKNKVTGIFFESKVDYTTWFGPNREYIHGIQNIPVTAITESVRDPQFVYEEWHQRLASVVHGATGTWNTVLYMSYATIQKHLAFQAMLSSGADDGLLRSWALYWAATRPDCKKYCDHDEANVASAPSGPYGGRPAKVPGKIQAEHFDYGWEGVGYSDTEGVNLGGAFRTGEGVDIGAVNGGFGVGWTRAGEYLRYTVDVERDIEAFDLSFVVAAPGGLAGSLRLVTDGDCSDYRTDLSGLVSVGSTGGWDVFKPLQASGGGTGGLLAGTKTIYLCIVTDGFNIDSFTMTAVANSPHGPTGTDPAGGPYGGKAAVIPGTIDATKFDLGGQGVAYSDTDPGNNGGAFRTDEAVDVGRAGDGYSVGWMRANEYLRYTVKVKRNVDAFDFVFKVAAPNGPSDGSFRLVSGGTGCANYTKDLSGLVSVGSTGGWGTYASLSVSPEGRAGLSAGAAVIWLCVHEAGFNIASFTMTEAM